MIFAKSYLFALLVVETNLLCRHGSHALLSVSKNWKTTRHHHILSHAANMKALFVSGSTSQSESTSVFIDRSGSTSRRNEYWDQVLEIVTAIGNEGAEYHLWNTAEMLTSFNDVVQTARSRDGQGGTTPECFAPIAAEGSHIVIITDGQVGQGSVTTCDSILKSREFASVKVYFFNTGGTINLSVSAPFTRKTDYIIYREGQVIAAGSTRKSTVLQEYFGDPNRFLADAEGILQELTVANMGMANLARRNELLELQKNLMETLAARAAEGKEDQKVRDRFAPLRESLLTKSLSLSEYHEEMRRLLTGVDGGLGKRIQSAIQLMINQCSGSSDYSFANLEPGRLQRAQALDPATAADVTIPEEDYKGNFKCPVDLNRALPTLLLATGDPVLGDLDKKYVDALITNPFLLLNDPMLVERVKERLDHVVGLDAAQDIFLQEEGGYTPSKTVVSPITGRGVNAAFTLGSDDSHRDATNFALADLLFGRKLVGQPELWLGVVYLIMRDSIPYLHNTESFMRAFKEHMVHRMRTQTTFMSLSGLPVDPMVRCPVDIAIWYCVNSPLIVCNNNPLEDDRNRLRSFGGGARHLVELLDDDVLGYPYDRTWTLRQLSIYQLFSRMMKADKSEDDPKSWRLRLRAQYQNSLTLSDGTVVLLDGPASLSGQAPPALFPSAGTSAASSGPRRGGMSTPTLSVGELVALSRLVDRTKTVGVVKIPLDLQAAVEGQDADYTVVQNYGLKPDAQYPFSVPICPATLRPYLVDKKTDLPWLVQFEKMAQGPVDKQLSVFSYFIRYVLSKKRFPTQEELIKYMATKQANRKDGQAKDTLPAQTAYFVSRIFDEYEAVLGEGFKDITVQEFIRTAGRSMDIVQRSAMEQGKQAPEAEAVPQDRQKEEEVEEEKFSRGGRGEEEEDRGTMAGELQTKDDDGTKERKVKEAVGVISSYVLDKTVDYLLDIKKKLQ